MNYHQQNKRNNEIAFASSHSCAVICHNSPLYISNADFNKNSKMKPLIVHILL